MPARKKLVSVIIVNWNGSSYLDTCLGSLAKQDYDAVEVIFVDNASTDHSVELVKKNFPKTKIVVSKKNLGFAGANNLGFHQATGEYVLFLNNDTRVTSTFLTELVKVVESSPKIAGAQSKMRLMDDPENLDSVGAFLTATGFLYHYGFIKPDGPKYDHQIPIFSAKGACMMFKRSVLQEVLVNGELFDPQFFAYFEETDVCHRVWLAGYTIVFAPKSLIYHKMGGTSKAMNSAFIQFHSFKNRINTYLKNLSSLELLKILPLHIFAAELYAFFSIFQNKGNPGIWLAIQKAVWWNVTHFGETMRERHYIQRTIRKVPDSKIHSLIYKPVRLSYYLHALNHLGNYEDEGV